MVLAETQDVRAEEGPGSPRSGAEAPIPRGWGGAGQVRSTLRRAVETRGGQVPPQKPKGGFSVQLYMNICFYSWVFLKIGDPSRWLPVGFLF